MKVIFLMMASLFALSGASVDLHPVDKVQKALTLTVTGMEQTHKIIHERILEVRAEISAIVAGEEEVLKNFDILATGWESYYQENQNFDFETLLDASLFAAEKHKEQTRSLHDQAPYLLKPLETAKILWVEAKERHVDLLTAALIKESLERGENTKEEIEAHFGKDVLALVLEVSDSNDLTDLENREAKIEKASTLSSEAKVLTMATQLYNLRELQKMEEKLKPSEALHQKILVEVSYEKKLFALITGVNPSLEEAVQKELSSWH